MSLKTINVTPVYDSTADSLTFVCFLKEDGILVTASLTSIVLSIRDITDTELFALSETTFTNGVAVLVKTTPGIVKNTVYYVRISFVCALGTLVSIETFVVFE